MRSKVFGNQDSSRNDDKAVYSNGKLYIMDSDFKESYSIEVNLWYNLEYFEESWNTDHIKYAWNILIFNDDEVEVYCKQYEDIHLYQVFYLTSLELYPILLDPVLKILSKEHFYNQVVVPFAYEIKDIKILSDFANNFNVGEGELHHNNMWQFIHSVILLPDKKKKPIDKQKGFI